MAEIKKDCFAHLSDNKYDGCFCLNELYCKKEECRFYQKAREAKEKYLDNYTVATAGTISRAIDKHFRNL